MIAFDISKKVLRENYDLLSKIYSEGNWFSNFNTIEFWVDGYNSFHNSEKKDFEIALSNFYTRSKNKEIVALSELDVFFDLLRLFVCNSARKNILYGYHSLCLVFCVLFQFKSIVSINEGSKTSLIDHPIMLIFSKSYRRSFFKSWNNGNRYFSAQNNEPSIFRPELGYSIAGEIDLVNDSNPRVQWYSINHNNLHINLFSDLYIQSKLNLNKYRQILVNIEAVLCHIDILYYYELQKAPINLFVTQSLRCIEHDINIGKRKKSKFFRKYSLNANTIDEGKQDILRYFNDVLQDKSNKKYDLSGWIQKGAVKRFMKWTDLAYKRNSIYSSITKYVFGNGENSLKRINYMKNNKYLSLCDLSFATDSILNVETRKENIKINDVRFLLVKIDELEKEINDFYTKKDLSIENLFSSFRAKVNGLNADDLFDVSVLQIEFLNSLCQKVNLTCEMKNNFTSRYYFYCEPHF